MISDALETPHLGSYFVNPELSETLKGDLIGIGNSQVIRIPRAVIDQCGFGQRVEMRVEGRSLIISPARAARSGWAEACKAMAQQGDDAAVLPDDLEHRFDEAEWKW